MTTDEAFGPSFLSGAAQGAWAQVRAGLWLLQTRDGATLKVVKLWAGQGFRYRWSLQAPGGEHDEGLVNDSLLWAQGDAELALWAWRARAPKEVRA
jgi:hypothetical protein